MPLIKKLIQLAGKRISIMPGAGLMMGDIQEVITKTGAREVHLGIGVRTPPTPTGKLDGRKVEEARRLLNCSKIK